MKFFMLGAISRVFQPGTKFDYIICIVGDQGAGKSSFFRLLAVQDEWFTDDLKDLESNRVYEKLQGHWIIELSEMLATNNAKSNEAIKSFLSRQTENYRTPYERYPRDRPKIESTISDDIKQSLLEKCRNLHFFEDKIMFQDETLIVEIQKILLQKGHYICGFSVQKNNLKSLFGMEG